MGKDQLEFHQNKEAKDKLQRWCKECNKKATHNWYLVNRQLSNNRSAKWGKENPKRKAEILAKSQNIRNAKYPVKRKAHDAVYRALRTGQLVKEPCSCGETKVQAHHESHKKDKWLVVEWLCIKCHTKKDKRKKEH